LATKSELFIDLLGGLVVALPAMLAWMVASNLKLDAAIQSKPQLIQYSICICIPNT
jgi:hypothetical protein